MSRVSRSLSFVVSMVALAGSGCTSYVTLLEPRQGDKVARLGTLPGPPFTWKIDLQTPRRVEYTLTVRAAGRTVYQKDRIADRRHEIAPGEGWLAGDTSYEWSVEGQEVDDEGQVRQVLPCKEARRFFVEKREIVMIQFSAPRYVPTEAEVAKLELSEEALERAREKGLPCDTEWTVGDETYTGDFELPLEVGEVRAVALRVKRGDKQIGAGGTIVVLLANENTSLGKVLVNDLKWDELERIAEKGDVGEHRYMLGGAEIARLKLGSRG